MNVAMNQRMQNLLAWGRIRGRRLLLWAASAWRHHAVLVVAALLSLISTLYWCVVASDLYVSEAHVLIQRTDAPAGPAVDFSALLSGAPTGSRADQFVLRNHMLSVDMLRRLDQQLDLRRHYSNRDKDLLSRMWAPDWTIEWFHRYFLRRVSVEFNEVDGVLSVRASAFDARTAHALVQQLLQDGDRFMNDMARSLAQEQVQFLEKQVTQLHERARRARAAVLAYQNKAGLVSPQATSASIAELIARLEGQRAELLVQRDASLAYLVPDHADIQLLNQKLAALDRQIAAEKARLATPRGSALNKNVEEFQRLEAEALFAEDLYKSAMLALEKGRIDATRNVKKISVVQSPTFPEYPLEPRRAYNSLVFALLIALAGGIVHLLAAIVRDHRD